MQYGSPKTTFNVADKRKKKPAESTALVVGFFKRGKIGVPFLVTKKTVKARLGHQPRNPSYMAVVDALNHGAKSVYIRRLRGAVPLAPPPQPSVTLTHYNGGQLNQTSFLCLLTTPPSNSLTVGDFNVISVTNGVATSINIAAAANIYNYYAAIGNNQEWVAFYAGQYVLAVDLDTPNNTAEITHSVTVTATLSGQQSTTPPWVYVQPYAAPQAPPSVMTLGADRVDNGNIFQFNIRSFGGANEYINVVFNTDTRIEKDGVFTCKRNGVVVPFVGSSVEKYGTHYRKTTFADQTDIPQGFPLKTKQYLTAPATITAFDDAGAFLQDNVHRYSIYVPVGDHIGTYTVSYSSSTTQIVDGITFTLTQ
jgi:hypothetical protein